MAVPPYAEDPEASRPHFRRLREIRERLADRFGRGLPELSMGMSHDFEVAVAEGSTEVRIGTALFGARETGVNVGDSVLAGVLEVVFIILTMIQWLVIAAALISWVSPDPRNPIVQFLYRVTEPILRPFRRLLPPGRTGGIDLSPILVILLIVFRKIFLSRLFLTSPRVI